MKPLNLVELNRRAFLIRSAATLGGLAPLIKVFPASALGAFQERPALTEAALAGTIQAARSRGPLAVNGLVMEVRADLGSFLKKRFALNPVQEAFVSRLSAKDLADIGTAFERGLATGNDLRIQIPDPVLVRGRLVAGGCEMTVNRLERPRVGGAGAESWSVVFVRQ